MIDSILDFCHEYSTFYVNYLNKRWDNITPMEYGMVLVVIAFIGWLLMKSGARRT